MYGKKATMQNKKPYNQSGVLGAMLLNCFLINSIIVNCDFYLSHFSGQHFCGGDVVIFIKPIGKKQFILFVTENNALAQ